MVEEETDLGTRCQTEVIINFTRRRMECMKVAICDDDLNYCGIMERHLLKIIKKYINLTIDIDVYQSGEEMLRIIETERVRPQILFLDMEMTQMNGIETARKLRNKDRNMLIIYVTSYDKYTMDSFEVSPFRYLLKPVDDKKIEQVFSAAVDEILNNQANLFFKHNNEQIQINCEEIISIVSEKGRMLRVNTIEERARNLFYAKIKDVEKQLNPSVFVKVNQGTIINLNFVHIISGEVTHLVNGEIVPISRGKKKTVKEAYSLYMKRKVGICL